MKKFILMIFIFLFLNNIYALELAKNAKSAILIEQSSGKVLYEHDSNIKRSPASMTKIMTLLLTFEKLDKGIISLDDEVYISKNASSMGGTQIYLESDTYEKLETLIKGIAIASANDAAVAIAEYVGGNEENFVSMMNDRARELGCKNTNFENPHGLDSENHYTTAYDLSLMAKELLNYEEILNYSSVYEDYVTVNGKEQWLVNTNKLVKFYNGVDGLKTGYTDNAGYCLTATMKKNNMRLISVVMGEDNKDNRTSDTTSLLEYGFSMYGVKNIINKKDYSNVVFISNSSKRKVNVYLKEDINLILDKDRENIDYKIKEKLYEVKAPLNKGDKVGSLIVSIDNEEYSYDLVVNEDVKKSNYLEYFINTFSDIITGKVNNIL